MVRYFFLFMSLSLFFVSSAQALITPDVMKTQIIKVYENNILAINRGLEDGIFKASHIKLTSSDGFIARGISLKSNMTISYIKIYRVVRPKLVSKDTLYDLRDMHQSEIPDDLKYLKNADLPYKLKEINPSELGKQLKLQQKRIAKFDLPESIKKAELEKPSETESFVQKNLNYNQLKKDFSKVRIELFASPYQTQTLNDQKDTKYGLNFNNYGEKFEFSFYHSLEESSLVDPYTGEQITTRAEQTRAIFDINKISDNWTYFMYGSRDVARTGELYNPKQRIQTGLFGLKYHITEPGELEAGEYGFELIDLSYIPLYENYTHEVYEDDTNTNVITKDEKYLRHAFRLRANARISESTRLLFTGWFRPKQDIDNGSFDVANSLTDISTTFSSNITAKFSFNYTVRYTYDIIQNDDYDIDPSNIINTASLNYSIPLNF